ncbi:small membrane protein [Klebsiella sp. MISC125]|uniref:small membrane protein n=1 Tax=Klebsiella sp. MISC125 TaxID=2755386 RepID=UPI003DA9B6BA
MSNFLMLILAFILFFVSIFYFISYVKNRRKMKVAFRPLRNISERSRGKRFR